MTTQYLGNRRILYGKLWLPLLLILGLARLWLVPLPSSFWVDEMATAFVVHFGAHHPSFAVAPQVPASLYYHLPKISEALFGFSEVSYRLPSILMMGIALFLVARLAARLIHPQAAWLAVFMCLSLRDINYEAANARPYALGVCVAAASLFFLVRWLDSAHWLDAFGFFLFAALLWRIHLIFWPLYFVLLLYPVVRIIRHETQVTWWAVSIVFVFVGLALIPVLLEAMALLREAKGHVIVPVPTIRTIQHAIKWRLILGCGLGAWLLSRWFRRYSWWKPDAACPSFSSLTLILAFWLWHPLALVAFSYITHDSVFVNRYLAVALPGIALAATAAASRFIPSTAWKPMTTAFAAGVLLLMGRWSDSHPMHHNSDWRGAVQAINALRWDSTTPIICPSPFIEAKPPAWRPDYPLPGFLYSYLPVYPVHGKPYLFPFEDSPEAEQYASLLAQTVLPSAGHFIVYGGNLNVRLWQKWFARQPSLQGWGSGSLDSFGDVDAVMFQRLNPRDRFPNGVETRRAE